MCRRELDTSTVYVLYASSVMNTSSRSFSTPATCNLVWERLMAYRGMGPTSVKVTGSFQLPRADRSLTRDRRIVSLRTAYVGVLY